MPDDEELPPDWKEMEEIGEKWNSVLKKTCKRCFAVIGSHECICINEVETEGSGTIP
jgi:hypothetical protein